VRGREMVERRLSNRFDDEDAGHAGESSGPHDARGATNLAIRRDSDALL
jgi:hypothetical protein